MAQFLAIILLIGVAVVAFKLAIILLFLAGLIFRTKETVGLMLLLGGLALFSAYPVASIAVIIAVCTVLLIMKAKPNDDAESEQLSLPLDD